VPLVCVSCIPTLVGGCLAPYARWHWPRSLTFADHSPDTQHPSEPLGQVPFTAHIGLAPTSSGTQPESPESLTHRMDTDQ
jgi:hypothetical protein